MAKLTISPDRSSRMIVAATNAEESALAATRLARAVTDYCRQLSEHRPAVTVNSLENIGALSEALWEAMDRAHDFAADALRDLRKDLKPSGKEDA